MLLATIISIYGLIGVTSADKLPDGGSTAPGTDNHIYGMSSKGLMGQLYMDAVLEKADGSYYDNVSCTIKVTKPLNSCADYLGIDVNITYHDGSKLVKATNSASKNKANSLSCGVVAGNKYATEGRAGVAMTDKNYGTWYGGLYVKFV